MVQLLLFIMIWDFSRFNIQNYFFAAWKMHNEKLFGPFTGFGYNNKL